MSCKYFNLDKKIKLLNHWMKFELGENVFA
jgi:hypothetical protein